MKKFFRSYTRVLLIGITAVVLFPAAAGDGLLYHMIMDGIPPALLRLILLLLAPYVVVPFLIKGFQLNKKRSQAKQAKKILT